MPEGRQVLTCTESVTSKTARWVVVCCSIEVSSSTVFCKEISEPQLVHIAYHNNLFFGALFAAESHAGSVPVAPHIA